MDKFPLQWRGKSVGELVVEQAGLYTWYTAACRLPDNQLWCVWVVGERGELRLGILEPAGEAACIRRRFSARMVQPLGKLLQGEIRPAAKTVTEQWETVSDPESLFQTPWLRCQLKDMNGVLIRKSGPRRYLAIPWDSAKPFPLPRLMCFPAVRPIRQRCYAVFCFDEAENPVFPQQNFSGNDKI